ncbi:MAG: CAP domain-containing protein [Boseongicola sp.]
MKTTIAAIAAGIVFIFASTVDAEACSRNVSSKAAKTVVPSSRVNQTLLDQAIRTEVNFHRCRAGLRSLADAGNGLANQAKKHSSWMARAQQLTHRSTVAGSATFKQRLKRSGVKFRTGAENIGMVHRYRIDNQRFKIVNSSACQFTTYDGKPLPAHSYASLARHVVNLWMNSPGHRKNILNSKVTKMSSGVAFDPKAQYCGRFWLTQNFVG